MKAVVKFDTKVWQKVLARVKGIAGKIVRVGVFGDAMDEDGFGMVERAAVHEFGSENGVIPERSFIRAGLRKAANDGSMQKICSELSGKVIAGTMDETQALKILGEWGVGIVRAFITAGDHIPPPLKPATVAAKGSDRPLVDTGGMVQSITSIVENT